MNILFVTTMYRCGEKVFPIIPVLAKRHTVDVLLYSQMSPETKWDNEKDLRIPLYKKWKTICRRVINGPGWFQIKDYVRDKKIKKVILNDSTYDLVIVDDNWIVKNKGLFFVTKFFMNRNIPVIACPHGNKEFKAYMGADNLGITHDYTFVFGRKEKERIKAKDKTKVIPAGIPSNDALQNYPKTNEYILYIPNFTPDSRGVKRAKKIGFKICDKKTFLDSGILKLAESAGCYILVKEKSRLYDSAKNMGLRKYLVDFGVKFVQDVEDDNRLICGAKCVISAPSTLAFKSIQKGIPTAILKGYGLIGNFFDFCGLVNCNKTQVSDTLKQQCEKGRDEEWIGKTLEGGVDYQSTQMYVEAIEKFG